MDLPSRALGWSLFSFNLGVEIGQLLVVVVVASAFAALRARSEAAGRRLVVAGSIVVVAAGTFWFVQRVFFPERHADRCRRVDTAKRVALVLAALSVAAAAGALAVVVSRLYGLDASDDSSRLLPWMLVPIALTIVGLLATRGNRIAVKWATVGALCGFVIAAAWSLGFFFAPAAVLLLASGVVEAHARGTRLWNGVFALLWMLEGVFGLAVAMLAVLLSSELLAGRYVVFPGQTREFSATMASVAFIPEALTFGAWMFVSVSFVLAAWHLTRVVWGKRDRLQGVAWSYVAVILVSGILLGALAARRAVGELQRNGGTGCASSGAGTTCWSR